MTSFRRRASGRNSLVAHLTKLEFGELSLVGREEELKQLRDAYEARNKNNNIVGVAGYSGVGKTALIETFTNQMMEHNDDDDEVCWVLKGKYDQQVSSLPYSAISMALMDLGGDDYKQQVQSSLKKNPMDESDVELILGIVPNLRGCFLHENNDNGNESDCSGDDDDASSGSLRLDRITGVLVSFFERLSMDRSVILCLDDVQWADSASLELVEALHERSTNNNSSSSTTTSNNLMVLLSWRSNEVEKGLEKLMKRCSPLVIVEVGNLSVESLHAILAEALEKRLEDETMLDLTHVIHHKTHGNVFFALQLMLGLHRKNLLQYSLRTYQWEWVLDDIQAETQLSENAVSVVTDKLRSLPPSSRAAAMIASCLGTSFDKRLVLNLLSADVLKNGGGITRREHEDQAIAELVASDVVLHRVGSDLLRFSHDQVQEAAYALFDDQSQREKMHFAIGQYLLVSSVLSPDLKQLLVTDQLNFGASSIAGSDEDRIMLMKHNHKAALVAIKKSAFVQAERFHRTAVELLPKAQLWSKHYELAIAMNSTWAETLLTLGEFSEVDRVIEEVINQARQPSDSCRVVTTKVDCLNCMNKLHEGFQFGYRHLRAVRYLKLPRKPNPFHAIRELLLAKRNVKKVPIEALLHKDACSKVDLSYQHLLVLFSENAWIRDDVHSAMYFFLKVFNLAYVQGPSRCTGIGVAFYGACLGSLGDFKASFAVSKWAKAFYERFPSLAFYPRVMVPCYGYLSHLQQPMHELIDPSLVCYKNAMRAGDMMQVSNSLMLYLFLYIHSGLRLEPFVCDVRRYRTIFYEKNECESIRVIIDMIGQGAANLIGDSRDPFELDGEFFDREQNRESVVEAPIGVARMFYWCISLFVSLFMDEYHATNEGAFFELYLSKNERPRLLLETLVVFSPPQCMYHVLVAIALQRKTGKRVYARKRRMLTKIVKKFVKNGVPGVSHRLLLIEAEAMTLNPRIPQAVVKNAFEEAISTSSRTGFVQDCAVANERCGTYFLRCQDLEWAEHYLKRAMQLYYDWGALAKVEAMQSLYGLSNGALTAQWMRSSSNLRSRERFSEADVERHSAGISTILFESGGNE